MGCLISIPFILLFIVLFFGSALLRIVQALFGGKGFSTAYGPENGNRQTQDADEDDIYSDDGPSYRHRHNGQRRKIFGPDEGEYVDFEEIKD